MSGRTGKARTPANVIPANAGIQEAHPCGQTSGRSERHLTEAACTQRGRGWIPAFAGMTKGCRLVIGGRSRVLFDAPRHRATDRGQSVIEFALVLPILLLVVFGITEFGRALMTVNILNAAAREGARVAAVGGDSTSAVARVTAVLVAGRVTNSAISVTHPDASRAITVTVTSQFQALSAKIITGLIPPITLRGQTVMRFEG